MRNIAFSFPDGKSVQLIFAVMVAGSAGLTQLAIVESSSAMEMITDEPIEQVLSLVSLDDPSPAASATIEAFRRIVRQGT